MRFLPSNYNPLDEIFKILSMPAPVQVTDLDKIQIELAKGGILVETEEEFVTVLDCLVEINPRKYVRKET